MTNFADFLDAPTVVIARPTRGEAHIELAAAQYMYDDMAQGLHSAQEWHAMADRLRHARRDALQTGAIKIGDEGHREVSSALLHAAQEGRAKSTQRTRARRAA